MYFTSMLFFFLQGQVCGSEEMHEHVNRRGAGRQVHQEAAARQVVSGGDPPGGGDAGDGARSSETRQPEGSVRDDTGTHPYHRVVS